MAEPIPTDAPLDDNARRKLAEIGIVSIDRFASAASIAPDQLKTLIGNDAFASMVDFIDAHFPDLKVGSHWLAEKPGGLGALPAASAPAEPLATFDVEKRDRLFQEATRLRGLGKTDEAANVDAQIDQLVRGVPKEKDL
jgi:hypothetical protein